MPFYSRKENPMLKKPNDYRQIIFLTVIFLIGLAMIFIPLVQQHQEIDADNNIYWLRKPWTPIRLPVP